MQPNQVLDSGVAQGSCFFRDSATTLGPDHGYLKDPDGTLGTGDFQYDLSQRKVVQCEFVTGFFLSLCDCVHACTAGADPATTLQGGFVRSPRR